MQPEPLGTPDTNLDPVATDSSSPSPAQHGVTTENDASAHEHCREHAVIAQLLQTNNELSVMARESLRMARALERTVARLQAETGARLDASPILVQADMAAIERS